MVLLLLLLGMLGHRRGLLLLLCVAASQGWRPLWHLELVDHALGPALLVLMPHPAASAELKVGALGVVDVLGVLPVNQHRQRRLILPVVGCSTKKNTNRYTAVTITMMMVSLCKLLSQGGLCTTKAAAAYLG